MNAEKQFNPSEIFSHDQMKTLAFSLVGYLKEFGTEEKPLTREKTAAHIGLSLATVDRMYATGRLKAHYVGSTPMFFPSEINEAIKKGLFRDLKKAS